MMAGNPSSWWSSNHSNHGQEQTPLPDPSSTHDPSLLSQQQHQQQTTTSLLFPSIQHDDDQYAVHACSDDAPTLHDGYEHNHATALHDQFPMSWSQLLLGGLVNEEERSYGTPQSAGRDQINQSRTKLIENCSNWETQQYLNNISTTTTTCPMPNIIEHLHIKQEDTQQSSNTLLYNNLDHHQDINVHDEADHQGAAGAYNYRLLATNYWPPHIISPPSSSSPKSCVTSSSSTTNNAINNNSNILDFSNNKSSLGYDDDQKNIQHTDHSHECNSTAATTGSGGAATKKARVQPSSTPPLKVRKEKLGDRITALHQLVSPFGKTDTASVLLEAIGYIRFLQGQIEALSSPYLSNSNSAKTHHHQQSAHGERNCLFPDHPGQLLNDSCLKRREGAASQDYNNKGAKDLKSRGLCLVPISCTHMVGNDNGADYWAPSFGGGF